MVLTVTKPTVGGSEDSWGTTINTALDDIVQEINSNADGTNAITPNLTEGSWEISTTPVTASAADLNAIDGFAATSVTVAELGYLSGATSNIQSQIDTINAASGSGTVTSVGLNMPTGFSVSGSPVTTSGTLSVTMASGYEIPTSTQVSNIPSSSDTSNWNTAYGWGDHSTAGYLASSQVGSTIAGLSYGGLGTYVFGAAYRTGVTDGSTVAGSSIEPAGHTDSNSSLADDGSIFPSTTKGGSALSGTWRAMGRSNVGSSNTYGRYTLFLKIAS